MNIIAESRRGIFFSAKASSSLGEISGKKIPFGYVIDQQGAAYDSTNGIFTAPGEGHYVFYTQIITPHGKYCNAFIARNGVSVANFISDSEHDMEDWNMGGNMVVVHLMTGEKVWIQAGDCHGIHARFTNVFIGFKIL